MKILRVLYVVAFALLAQTKASADWLPPQVEQVVIQQLADRLSEAGFAWDSEQQRMEGAAHVISGMRKYIMEPVAQSIIQNQHGLREHAAAQCAPFVLPFLEFLSEE